MKKIFAILMILSICAVGRAATDSNNAIVPGSNNTAVPDTNITASYQEKIRQLERTIESLQKRLDKIILARNELKKENEQLKALLPKEKTTVDKKPVTNFDPNNGVVYRGKTRNKQWFNMMYKEFQDKIAFVDGKYIYLDKNKIIDGDVKDFIFRFDPESGLIKSAPEGTLIKLHWLGTVLQVLGQGEALISRGKYGERSDIYHIKGYKGSLVDKQMLVDSKGYFYLIKPVGAGTFEYIDTSGAKRTIQSFVVCEPLTREQFADAINSGFILTRQSKVGDKTVEQPIP